MLGIEPRALRMLGKYSTKRAMSVASRVKINPASGLIFLLKQLGQEQRAFPGVNGQEQEKRGRGDSHLRLSHGGEDG